jgi:hypothetical protein
MGVAGEYERFILTASFKVALSLSLFRDYRNNYFASFFLSGGGF